MWPPVQKCIDFYKLPCISITEHRMNLPWFTFLFSMIQLSIWYAFRHFWAIFKMFILAFGPHKEPPFSGGRFRIWAFTQDILGSRKNTWDRFHLLVVPSSLLVWTIEDIFKDNHCMCMYRGIFAGFANKKMSSISKIWTCHSLPHECRKVFSGIQIQ